MRPQDFPVTECVTHHYFDEVKGPGWRWYCLTCDTGTQVRKHGRRLHRLEGDAAVGAKYHRNQMRRNRQAERARAWHYQCLLNARTVAEFAKAWGFMYGGYGGFGDHVSEMEREKVMREIQADAWLVSAARMLRERDELQYGPGALAQAARDYERGQVVPAVP